MRREVAGERGAVRLEDGREVLDVGGFVHLAAEAVGNDARTQALAGGVDGGRAARRAAADNEYVKRGFGADRGLSRFGDGRVELGEDFGELAAAGEEGLAVEEDRRNGHHVAACGLLAEERSVDHGDGGVRVEDRDEVKRLHDFRAVVAGERDEDLEVERALEGCDLAGLLVGDLGGMAARLQKGEHEAREFMAHREAGEANAFVTALRGDCEAGTANGGVGLDLVGDLVRKLGDFLEERLDVGGVLRAVKGGLEHDGTAEFGEVALQLGFDVGVKHDG